MNNEIDPAMKKKLIESERIRQKLMKEKVTKNEIGLQQALNSFS